MQVRGYSHPDFRSLRQTVRRCAPVHGPGGVAVAVYHRGELVADLACGTRDRQGSPFEPETLALSMSTGKGVMATLLHMAIDRGLVDLDVPVARYWPAFGKNGKERHHGPTGGITPSWALLDRADHRFGRRDVRLGPHGRRSSPTCGRSIGPTRTFGYHAWTGGWIVGEILQRVTGKPFPRARERVSLRSAGASTDCTWVIPESELPRVSEFLIPTDSAQSLSAEGRVECAHR